MKQIEWLCPVVDSQRLNDQFLILTLRSQAISQSAQPGQFVNLSCQQFLRRPFGIMTVDREQETFQVGIQVKGKGTQQLSHLKAGDEVSVLGPLGHGFDLDRISRVITVGGGTGVFPLYFVQQAARAKNLDTIAVCGYRSAADSILRDAFKQVSDQAVFASDLGDLDVHGHAGQALQQVLDDLVELAAAGQAAPLDRSTAILTCGPKIMMQKVAELAKAYGVACQVSLEEHMGCGIGICLVCVCKIKAQESGEISHQRCCVEGPVFPAEDVVW